VRCAQYAFIVQVAVNCSIFLRMSRKDTSIDKNSFLEKTESTLEGEK